MRQNVQGGHQFFADLINAIKKMNATSGKPVPLEIDFIRSVSLALRGWKGSPPFRHKNSLKSYENMSSSGYVQVIGGDDLESLKGKNILIVEDMIDSGKTMVKLLATLEKFQPKAVRVARSVIFAVGISPYLSSFLQLVCEAHHPQHRLPP
jgi:hypoxanthine phosphoribosyltransferase